MTPEARVAAAIDILDAVLDGAVAEQTLTNWGRSHRFAGSGDRAAIRDHVFDALRRLRSSEWSGQGRTGRRVMLGLLRSRGEDPDAVFTGMGHAPAPLTDAERAVPPPLDEAPEAVRLDVQDWVLPRLQASLGDATASVLDALRDRAPVFLRVNAARTTREAVQSDLAGEAIETRPHPLCDTVLQVTGHARRVQASAAYRDGLVELQDAASQAAVSTLLPYVRGATVLDYCAGGGGKALALAAGGAGRVLAHDVNPGRMSDLPARAERAGCRIDIVARPKGGMDAVLCDAPCSGSGAWRRQPEAKWRLTSQALEELTRIQGTILDEASPLVRPGGYLAYATCSLLAEENGARIDAFLTRTKGWTEVERQRWTPLDGGDGFFVAVLRRAT